MSYDYPCLGFNPIITFDANWKATSKTRAEYLRTIERNARASGAVTIAFDFEPFHAGRGSAGSRNYLYLDGHVDNF